MILQKKIYQERKPSLKAFGVLSGAKAYWKVVRIDRGVWTIVPKKGAPGTIRQTVKQSSSKNMREGRFGRKTLKIRNMFSARAESTDTKKSVKARAPRGDMTLTECWELFK